MCLIEIRRINLKVLAPDSQGKETNESGVERRKDWARPFVRVNTSSFFCALILVLGWHVKLTLSLASEVLLCNGGGGGRSEYRGWKVPRMLLMGFT